LTAHLRVIAAAADDHDVLRRHSRDAAAAAAQLLDGAHVTIELFEGEVGGTCSRDPCALGHSPVRGATEWVKHVEVCI
jgi:hypothetical protein